MPPRMPRRPRPMPAALCATVCALAVAGAGCGVDGRESLIGRYVVPATGEAWTLRDDGTCSIERSRVVLACEWEYRDRLGETRLVVTAADPADAARRHSLRYVLTPSKWPGRPITIPLSPSATLEKRNGAPEGGATR